MLVLSRHKDEAIVIDGDIIVTVVDIRGDKVHLGIHAPKEVAIDRQEIYEKKMQNGHFTQPAARDEP